MFCPKCGSVMLPKKEGSKKILICSCGYKDSNVERTKITETMTKKEREIEVIEKEVDILPKTKVTCDKCGNKLVRRKSDDLEVIKARLQSDEEQIRSFLPSFKTKGLLQTLPIIVNDDQKIDDRNLKKLKGEVYWVQTDTGDKARMLNFEGMRRRLHNLLKKKFIEV